jgi:hypothetical protein
MRSSVDWETLRRKFGHPLPDHLRTFEKQTRPGHWRKVYGSTVTKRYVLRPTTWNLSKQLCAPEEVVKHLNKRPLLGLQEEIEKSLQQIFARAYCGEDEAIRLMISTARGVVHAVEDLETYQGAKLKEKAEASPLWPVLFSLNPQDIKQAKERVARLNVGTKALTPRRPGQRVDARNFWTNLAQEALHQCEDNRVNVPILEAYAKGVSRERKTLEFWQTRAAATYYYVSNRNCIIITDWESRCKTLQAPIAEKNFDQWWAVVQLCVINYWWDNRKAYEAALKKIGRADEEESRRRNLAMTALHQALRSLVGLR